MKTYINDGYNLLWKTSPAMMDESRLEEARSGLEMKLQEFLSLGGASDILLVYDGRGRGSRPGPGRSGLRICFSPDGKTADNTILDFALSYSGRGEVLVVSSDLKDIGRRLGGTRARPVTSERFLDVMEEKLRSARGGDGDARQADEKPPPPRGEDIDRWLQDFDMKED